MAGSPSNRTLAALVSLGLALIGTAWGVTLARGRSGGAGNASNAGAAVQLSRPLMGTVFTITVWSPAGSESAAFRAIAQALDGVGELEERISSWQATSQTSAINRAAGGDPVPIGPELAALLEASIDWARRTGGAFDVTGGPLFDVWQQARQDGVLPEESRIAARLALVGYEKIEMGEGTARLARPGMRLDFGAIGKGFAADRAATVLREAGFPDALIDAGGDLHIGGTRGGERWRVGVRHPRRPGMLATLAASDRAVATSGDYEQFFTIDGMRYGHVIDLRTGRPVRGVTSVTVIARTATAADALATGLYVLGAQQGLELVEGLPGTEALFVLEDGTIRCSTGLRFDGDTVELVE
jgi:thiamine biosynthesis lipoprotein